MTFLYEKIITVEKFSILKGYHWWFFYMKGSLSIIFKYGENKWKDNRWWTFKMKRSAFSTILHEKIIVHKFSMLKGYNWWFFNMIISYLASFLYDMMFVVDFSFEKDVVDDIHLKFINQLTWINFQET